MGIVKTIGEYISAVKNGIKNKDKIIEGMYVSAAIKNKSKDENNDIEITDEAIAEIMRRKEICAGCKYNSANAKINGDYYANLPYQHCTLCLCRIGADDSKEYCLSCNCGAQAYNENHPTYPPIEVKWTSFENKKQ
jgi:hypothetical protein